MTYVGVPVTPIALPSAWSASTISRCRPSISAVSNSSASRPSSRATSSSNCSPRVAEFGGARPARRPRRRRPCPARTPPRRPAPRRRRACASPAGSAAAGSPAAPRTAPAARSGRAARGDSRGTGARTSTSSTGRVAASSMRDSLSAPRSAPDPGDLPESGSGHGLITRGVAEWRHADHDRLCRALRGRPGRRLPDGLPAALRRRHPHRRVLAGPGGPRDGGSDRPGRQDRQSGRHVGCGSRARSHRLGGLRGAGRRVRAVRHRARGRTQERRPQGAPRRGPRRGPPAATGKAGAPAVGAGGAPSATPESRSASTAQGKKRASGGGDDDFSDIEAILKKHGI